MKVTTTPQTTTTTRKAAVTMTRARVKSLQALHEIYRAELYGAAFFTHFLRHYDGDDRVSLVWKTLLQVEQRTALYLKVALEESGVACSADDPAATAEGIRQASKWISFARKPLVETMVDWVSPYQQKYQKMADSSTAYGHLFRLVADHENAIYKFLVAEQKGEPSGLGHLQEYLAKYPTLE